VRFAPAEKPIASAGIGPARVVVGDVGGEELSVVVARAPGAMMAESCSVIRAAGGWFQAAGALPNPDSLWYSIDSERRTEPAGPHCTRAHARGRARKQPRASIVSDAPSSATGRPSRKGKGAAAGRRGSGRAGGRVATPSPDHREGAPAGSRWSSPWNHRSGAITRVTQSIGEHEDVPGWGTRGHFS